MRFLLASLFLLTALTLQARDVPSLSGPVVDEVGLLDWNTKRKVENSLRAFHETKGHQIQLLIVKTLDGESIEGFSIRVTDKWKLGDAKADNGVLFLIAPNDRQMRIEVGQGLEGVLTDLQAGRIIDSVVPFFKQGQFQAGIIMGLTQITHTLGGELENVPVRTVKNRRNKSSLSFWLFLIFFMMIFGRGRFGFLPWIILGGGRSSGGGWSSGGGGGGWSGGGGGFSGGGASGRW